MDRRSLLDYENSLMFLLSLPELVLDPKKKENDTQHDRYWCPFPDQSLVYKTQNASEPYANKPWAYKLNMIIRSASISIKLTWRFKSLALSAYTRDSEVSRLDISLTSALKKQEEDEHTALLIQKP